ncbi:MAG: aldo/keto reductase, partial [Bacteroidales bacterium]|nr:aldo/keto reductase [Bacteroidales bacterium]
KAVNMQFTESLSRLSSNYLDLLYFHFPDMETQAEKALEACNILYQQGKIKEFGLSNFPAWKVVDLWHICDRNNWLKPTVYQGLYNGLSRKVECELFEVVKNYRMRFYAYNPLAGGFLTGKYSSYSKKPSLGRFTYRPGYKDRYWKPSFFKAIKVIEKECKKNRIPIAEAAYRWLAFHSMLDFSRGDAIVIGASKLEQLQQNIQSLAGGPLPVNVVEAFSSAWEISKADSPEYYRTSK